MLEAAARGLGAGRTRRYLTVRLTPHKLRHAYGTHCVDRGIDIRIIAEVLGHKSLESTKIYTVRSKSVILVDVHPGLLS